ncbi:MAG: DNA primase [Rhodothermales bacterium]
MFIPDDKLEEIRSVCDITEVVSGYVSLKKNGANYFGLCPFHNEKSPSFSVNPGMGIFKCFGCGVGGDVFQFVMQMEHVTFPEAARMLAAQAGIDIPEDGQSGGASSEAESLQHVLRHAARFYYRMLVETEEGRASLEYLLGRGISRQSIKAFGLGYAPDRWDALVSDAVASHLKVELLERAGLVIHRKSGVGYYDRFRGRIMFPILSHTGKVVGFGGRILVDAAEQPKYINTPETPVYHKSEVLYGLSQARRAIRDRTEVYVVEGYTDVIAMHQHGVTNVVASCGTSLTADHLRILKRYAESVIFLNDSDAAGDASNLRSIDLALRHGLTPYVVELPDGEDPASFLEHHGSEALHAYLNNDAHKWTFVQYLLIRAKTDGTLKAVEGERKAFDSILERIAGLESRFEQDTYLHQMAEALGKPLIHLQEEFRRAARRAKNKSQAPQRNEFVPEQEYVAPSVDRTRDDPAAASRQRILPEEEILIRLMLERGASLVEFVLSNMALDEFTPGVPQKIVEQLIDQYNSGLVDSRPFVDGTFGADVKHLVTGLLVDRHLPSENWQKMLNIKVPRINEDPLESAASAMMLLKLDRVDESIREVKVRHDKRQAAGVEVRTELEELMALKTLRRQIERREFLDWNEA